MAEYRQGSIFIRQCVDFMQAGETIEGHKHNFDHTTFFGTGLWKVECFGDVIGPDERPIDGQRVKLREVTIRGGSVHPFLLIQAGVEHRLTCLEGPGTYFCVYSHRTPEGDVTPEYNGWNDAYV
jgi:hypothetical protein